MEMRPRALVVEDDTITSTLLRRLLEQQGCQVDVAADGRIALDLAVKNDYQVILLDIVLPKLSGTEVMERLRVARPEALARVIVVTGLDVKDIRKLFPTTCDALSKPVMPGRLVTSLNKCLRSGVASPAEVVH